MSSTSRGDFKGGLDEGQIARTARRTLKMLRDG
jgi:hypothetical protein